MGSSLSVSPALRRWCVAASFALGFFIANAGLPAVQAAGADDAPERIAERLETMADTLRGLPSNDTTRIHNIAAEMARLAPTPGPALDALTRDPEASVRRAAVRAVGVRWGAGGEAGDLVPSMIIRISDDDVYVAREATRALGKVTDPWAAQALVRWLGHPDAVVREAAMGSLEGQDAAVVRRALRSQLAAPPERVGPNPYLTALGRYPDKNAERDLIKALDKPSQSEAALAGIVYMGPKAARGLAGWIKKRRNSADAPLVPAMRVLIGMGDVGVERASSLLHRLPTEAREVGLNGILSHEPERAPERLSALAGHKDADMRRTALELMALVPGTNSKATLANNLRDPEADIRILAAAAVKGPERDKDVEAMLIERYREVAKSRTTENAEERSGLLRAMGRVGHEASSSQLVQATGRDDEMRAALVGLGSLGPPAIGPLLFVIKSGDPVRTPFAVEALGQVGPDAVEPMLALLVHPSRDVRNTARVALAGMKSPEAVPGIVRLLQNPKTPGRAPLVALLGAVENDTALEAVIELAKHATDNGIRQAAVKVLGRSSEVSVRPVLRSIAEDDPNNEVRHLAVQALFWQGDTEAVPLLAAIARTDKAFIRRAAALALGYLAGPDDLLLVSEAMDTPRSEVLVAARGALQNITGDPSLMSIPAFIAWDEQRRATDVAPREGRVDDVTLGDGTVMAYRMVGKGRPLVIIHGGPDFDHRYLRTGLDPLAEDRMLVYVDLPGRGNSTISPKDTVRLGVVADADAVSGLLAHLNLSGVDVYGHGWGAVVAAALVSGHPKRVRRAIFDSAPMPTRSGWNDAQRLAFERAKLPWHNNMAMFRSQGGLFQPAALDAFVTRVATTGRMRNVAPLYRMHGLLGTRPQMRIAWLGAEGDFDHRARFATVGVPSLLLYGDDAPLSEAGMAWRKSLNADLSTMRLSVIPNTGAFAMLENPVAFQETLRDFLD